MSDETLSQTMQRTARKAHFDFRILPFLVLLTVLAFYLRAWDSDFGLPVLYHPDEGRKVILITDVAAGRVQSNFSHPPLMINVNALVLKMADQIQWMSDWNLSLFDQRLLLGRLVSAIVGALTVIPVFLLARNLYGLTAAFVAGLAIAVSPMHVLNSHYLKEEVYLCFFVILSTLFFVKWSAKRKVKTLNLWYYLSAVSVGAASASKYVGAITLLMFLVILHINIKPLGEKLKLMLLATLLATLTFFVLSPQISYNFPVFVRDFSYETSHGATGANRETLNFWEAHDRGLFYLREGILWGIGWPIALTAGLSALIYSIRKPRRRAIIIVISTTLLWYAVAELTPAKRGIGRDRYVLSVLPFLAVLSGGFIHYVRRLEIPGARLWTIIFGVAMVLPSAWMTYDQVTSMTPDTREIARTFFEKYYSEDDFRIVHYGGYDPVQHPMARVSERSPNSGTWPGLLERLNEARFFTSSSFGLDRYEKFPDLNPDVIDMLRDIRAMFPYVARFKKEDRVSHEFHNPVIEIRTKKSRPGFVYEGSDPAEKRADDELQAKWISDEKAQEFNESRKVYKAEQKALKKAGGAKKSKGFDEG